MSGERTPGDSCPAFPTTAPSGDQFGGLTLREYFAGVALQGMLANPSTVSIDTNEMHIAKWAVSQADALLAELAKQGAT